MDRPRVAGLRIARPTLVRPLYLATLLTLQLALILSFAYPLTRAIRLDAAPGMAPVGWPAMLQLAATIAAITGTTLTLVVPGVALIRHWHEGPFRFAALPRWATALAVAGTAILGVAMLSIALVPMMPADVQMTAVLIARPAVACGLALAGAGVFSAEVLRRTVGHSSPTAFRGRKRSGRIEVVHPPELRTRAVGLPQGSTFQ